jgi:xanthine/uracil/vitamin C permease (AzgA family)
MLNERFGLERHHTTVRTEVVAGITTFLTMAYIILVNPAILSAAGMDKQALVIVTCIASAVTTAIMGLIGNAPIAMAPGMGLNAFLAYSLVKAGQITWQTALGVVFLSGLLGVVLTLVGLRKRLVEAIPVSLITAISVGIGLFITFIGLVNMGVIVKNDATLVSAGPITGTVAIGLAGLLLMAFLEIRKVKGALLVGMVFSTVLAVLFGYAGKPLDRTELLFAVLGIVVISLLPMIAAVKGFDPWRWGLAGGIPGLMGFLHPWVGPTWILTGGIVVLIILLCMRSAKGVWTDEGTRSRRREIGNTVGRAICLVAIALAIGIHLSMFIALRGVQEQGESMVDSLGKVTFQLDIVGALKWSLFGSIFTLMFMDMFDGIGTLVACCHEAGMVDEQGKIRRLGRLLVLDASASMIGALLGTSSVTAYIESAAGIEQGGRTGLTALVTAACFVLALVFVPVVGIVPEYATAPALVMVGLFMMKEIKRIDFANMEEALPAFIILVMIALSYSISTGLAFGFISFVLIKLVAGKVGEVKPTMWVIALLSLGFVTTDHLRAIFQ